MSKRAGRCWNAISAARGYDPQQIIKNAAHQSRGKELNCSSMEDLYSSIGYGGTMMAKVLDLLLRFYEEEKRTSRKK